VRRLLVLDQFLRAYVQGQRSVDTFPQFGDQEELYGLFSGSHSGMHTKGTDLRVHVHKLAVLLGDHS
jgi:hypothetical protein